MNKPLFLYHASQNRNINMFEPRLGSFRDKDEGPVIFATPDKTLASIFIVPTNDLWAHSGLFGKVHYFICGDQDKFINLDNGGAIYTLPSFTFETDPKKGLGTKEWVNKASVKPISKEEYQSGLQAMLSLGVQVYFVDNIKFQEIGKSHDHGNEIVRNSVSENKNRNSNYLEIPFVQSVLAEAKETTSQDSIR